MRIWMDEADGPHPHVKFHIEAISGEDRRFLSYLAELLVESDDMCFQGFEYTPGGRGALHIEVVPYDYGPRGPFGINLKASALERVWKKRAKEIVLTLLNEDLTRRGVYIPHAIRLVPPDHMEE